MSVNFKVGFTISGEALFALFAKLLPIEDISIEELRPKPTLAERAIAVTHQAKGSRRRSQVRLNQGINKVIMDAMSSGPKRALELHAPVTAAGYSPNSVNSRLESLRLKGIIDRVGDGTWRVKDVRSL